MAKNTHVIPFRKMNEAVQKDETPSAGLGSQNDASLLEQLATRIEEVKDLVGIDARKHLAVIEGLLQKAQSENAELKTNVVEALSVGTQLREENRALQEELVQLKLLDMVDQTQTLNSIAYEYNEDIINAHRKERDELLAALEDCQQQVRFLEDENMLLRDKVGESEGMNEKRFENEYTISKDSSVIGVEDGEDGDPRHEATSVRSCSTSYPSADNLNNPISIAEALKNEATPDIILAAIGMLQGYVVIQELLEKEKMSRKRLTNEVLELNEIINAKTFKPPSAWAERELKYKQEKRQWEEERKVADAEISTLKKQLEDLRNSSGTSALEHRIEFLESRLLESERNLAIARATIHEMELASRASEGEFSMSGVKPYLGPRGAEGDVSHAVEKLETSFNGTPVRQSPSISSSSNVFSPSNVAVIAEAQNLRRTTDYGRFIGNEKENELSKVRLDQLSGGHDVFRTPETVPQKVRRLERELMQLNADKFQLNQELKGLKASVSTNSRHELGRPDENGVDVSKTEINLSNAIEPCNDSLKLDESQAEILVVQQRIEVHLRVVE